MPRPLESIVQTASVEMVDLDLERANRLEEIATRHGVLAQVQEEIDALRSESRLVERQSQLRRSFRMVPVMES